eukprot:CAMPEP_0169335832 /NCGR_PEP_ID=MMETSP1017-20121227/16549_1 /TAXON_ID=342587 /ORGANISM="Karlodinium micrum, Strain CCMP2283" /LENGTH=405 /DNA_ID=CAMNT_0009431239 /DNA_START=21 /DNA_END=1238 /DNA_ORIENTATION=+
MAHATHVVVRNTFLEFSDDTPSLEHEPRKVRAMSDMTDSKIQTKVELNDSGIYQLSRHRLASTLEGGYGQSPQSVGSSPSVGIIGTTTSLLPTVVEEPEGGSFGRRRTSSLVYESSLAQPPFPVGTQTGMPWMGGVGQVPYSGLNPYFGLNPSVSPGMTGPQMPAPPFPPGAFPFGGYPGLAQQLPPGNFGQPQVQTSVARGGTTSYRAAAPDNGRNRLQLFDSLQDAGSRGAVLAQSSATAGAGTWQTEEPPKPPGELTTIMLRNVPNGYTRTMLLELIDGMGFQGRYDFVYLPMDFRNGVNLGYAFVNSLTHEDAMRLTEKLQGFSLWSADCSKICEVSWAHPNQGLAEHVERYRNSPVMHNTMPDDYKPMVFRGGVRIPFPQPTKAIKAPKLRLTPNPKAAA